MIRYNPINQVKIEEFKTPFEIKLDKNNRWVKLGELICWDQLAQIYYQKMSIDEGRPSIDARRIIGAMLIKHKLVLSDEETVLQIQENPYLQFFLGYQQYESEPVFNPTLFVAIRKRLGVQEFNKMNDTLIQAAFSSKTTSTRIVKRINNKHEIIGDNENNTIDGNRCCDSDGTDSGGSAKTAMESENSETQPQDKHKGKMLIDATVADQAIKYPTDLDLLNNSRKFSEELIDNLYKARLVAKKPRTYRRKARKEFLSLAKKKNKTRSELRKVLGKQLNYLRRNLTNIDKILDSRSSASFPLSKQEQKRLWVIREIYRQQKEMHVERKHSCDDRLVSISQPYVRPIVRGKQHKPVEFGAKIGVSLCNGFAKLDNISWDAYNESSDLPMQVENFKKTYGHYPEAVLADQIYGTQKNREYLKSKGIRFAGKPLGRPRKQTIENRSEIASEKRRRQKEYSERIPIEGKFGQGKNGYRLNYIRARLKETSESWISCIFFVMNVINMTNTMRKKINSILNSDFLGLKNNFQFIFASRKFSLA